MEINDCIIDLDELKCELSLSDEMIDLLEIIDLRAKKLITIENLTITGGSNSDSNAFTIYTSYVDSEGKTQKLDIRVSQNVNLVGPDGTRITKYDYF